MQNPARSWNERDRGTSHTDPGGTVRPGHVPTSGRPPAIGRAPQAQRDKLAQQQFVWKRSAPEPADPFGHASSRAESPTNRMTPAFLDNDTGTVYVAASEPAAARGRLASTALTPVAQRKLQRIAPPTPREVRQTAPAHEVVEYDDIERDAEHDYEAELLSDPDHIIGNGDEIQYLYDENARLEGVVARLEDTNARLEHVNARMEHANRELNDKIGRLAAEIKELRLAAGRQQEAREKRAAPVPARSRQTAAAPAVPVARRNNKDAPPARVAFEADIADANTNDNEPVEAAPAAKTPVKKPSYAHVAAGKDQRIHEQHVANKSDKEKAAWSKLFQLVQQQKESRPQSHVPAKLEPKVENRHNKRVLFFDNAPFMPLKELRQTFSDVNLRTGAIFDIKYIGSTKLQVTCAANYAPTLIFELEKGSRCKHNAKYDPRSVRKNATPEERERYLTSFVNRTLDTIVNSRAAHVRNFYRSATTLAQGPSRPDGH
ncbi:hypothetical protein BC831DRAFT_531843 [Entophlyctis helioformis]|nr:hypothetical protein BC831DRAFT_531843 [Entophlyctis helioformis]